MELTIIQDIEVFAKLRDSWNTIYKQDPHATIFLSWSWLLGRFNDTDSNWFILAAQAEEDSKYVAFFPLITSKKTRFGFSSYNSLTMGGAPLADYTGIVCLPDVEQQVLSAFAKFIKTKLSWNRFDLIDVLDERINVFFSYFPQNRYEITQIKQTSCFDFELPGTWDGYFQHKLGPKTRRNLRKIFQKSEMLDSLEKYIADENNINQQIDDLLFLWQLRWGQKSEGYLDQIRSVFKSSLQGDCLRILIYKYDGRPVAGLAAFLDFEKKTVFEFMNCFDSAFKEIRSPGLFIVASNIRDSIENGFKRYDFLRGNEGYKLKLGATEKFNRSYYIVRKDFIFFLKRMMKALLLK